MTSPPSPRGVRPVERNKLEPNKLEPETAELTALDLTAAVRRLVDEDDAARRVELYRALGADLELLQAFKEEVDRLKDADGARALRTGRRAHELGQWLGDLRARALGSWSLALGLTVQGEFEEALVQFEQARQAYQALGMAEKAAKVGIRQVQALAMTGNYDGALQLVEEVRETFIAAGLDREAGLAFNNTGAIYSRMSRFEEAEAAFRQALERLERVGDPIGIAQTRVNLGYASQEQDRFRAARQHFEAALTIFTELDMVQSVAGTLVDLALLFRREGHLNDALGHLSRARLLYSRLGAETDAALAQLEEARIHFELNLLEEAEALAEETVGFFAQREMQLEALEASGLLGLVRLRAGRWEEARKSLEQTRDGWLQLGNSARAAQIDVYLAGLHLLLARAGEPERAQRGLQLADGAVATLAESGSRVERAMGLMTRAELLIFLGRTATAVDALAEADAIANEVGVPNLVMRSRLLLGRLAAADGNIDAAKAYFSQSIEALESVRASLAVDEFKAAYLGDRLDVYGEMVTLLLDEGRNLEALAYVERAKARALVDLMAGGVRSVADGDDPELVRLAEELDAAREELNWHYLTAERFGEEHWAKVIACEKRVTALLRELERLRPQAADLERVAVPEIATVISDLDDDTILLEYYAVEGELLAFVVTAGEVRVVRGLGSLEKVQTRLDQLHMALHRTAQGKAYAQYFGEEMLTRRVTSALRNLHEVLLAPLAEQLDRPNLIVIPHGVLHAIPFAALHDGDGYLLDHHRVSLAPSATVYSLCRHQPQASGETLVAFGVPVEDIPAVQYEVDTVVGMFPDATAHVGAAATLDSFRRHAPAAKVLHVATHGVFRPGNPMFSGLRMADGWLAARDLYQLRLDASLVVLSACESGLAGGDGGDEQMGLIRGFLHAGASSLTVSHWAVKDEQTAQLMIAFYRHLRSGMTVAEALRAAQLELRHKAPNPYFWAAFAVIGDPDRRIVTGEAPIVTGEAP